MYGSPSGGGRRGSHNRAQGSDHKSLHLYQRNRAAQMSNSRGVSVNSNTAALRFSVFAQSAETEEVNFVDRGEENEKGPGRAQKKLG